MHSDTFVHVCYCFSIKQKTQRPHRKIYTTLTFDIFVANTVKIKIQVQVSSILNLGHHIEAKLMYL